MRLAVHADPFLGDQLAVCDRVADGRAENFRAAARHGVHTGLFERLEHLDAGDALDPCQMRDLDCGERLDLRLGVALLEPADEIGVVFQPQLRVQPSDDVEFANPQLPRTLGLLERFLQRHGVGSGVRRAHAEGAEHAHRIQYTDVSWVDVLIGDEVDAIPVHPPVHEVGHSADSQKVIGLEQRHGFFETQSLPCPDLIGDRVQRRIAGSHGQI